MSDGSLPAQSKPVSNPATNAHSSAAQVAARGDIFQFKRSTSQFSNMANTSAPNGP